MAAGTGPSGGIAGRAATWTGRSAAAASLLLLGGCTKALLDPAGPIASANMTIMVDSLAIMLAIVIPTIAACLGFAWWFRASNTQAKYLPDWEFSGQLEMLVWSVPTLTIMLLGGVTWIGSHDLDPAKPIASDKPPLEVQVVSLDWKWLFILPEQKVAAVNQLTVPVGVPVHFTLTSASVWNSFFVPQLGSQIYTMNGMASQLWLKADQPGSYYGLSTHFSGDEFSKMSFSVDAVSQDRFSAWVELARGAASALDQASYAELAKQGTVPPRTYRDVQASLFRDVVAQKIPPAPGPIESGGGQAGQPGPTTPAGGPRASAGDAATRTAQASNRQPSAQAGTAARTTGQD